MDLNEVLDGLNFAGVFFKARADMATPGEAKIRLVHCEKVCREAIDLLTPRVLKPEEYDTWTGDAWVEDFDSGIVTAIDRSAVKAYGKYVRFDRDGAKRLWTGRPSEEQRKATPWE